MPFVTIAETPFSTQKPSRSPPPQRKNRLSDDYIGMPEPAAFHDTETRTATEIEVSSLMQTNLLCYNSGHGVSHTNSENVA
jgi:hypothetical protein